MKKCRTEDKELHHLNPIRRNAKYIATHDLYNYDCGAARTRWVTFREAHVDGDGK